MLGAVAVLCIVYLVFAERKKQKRLKSLSRFNTSNKKKENAFASSYKGMFLSRSNMKLRTLLLLKLFIFIGAIALVVLVKSTNIAMTTDKAFNVVEYEADIQYTSMIDKVKDPQRAFQQEIQALNEVLASYTDEDLRTSGIQDVSFFVGTWVENSQIELAEDPDLFSNRVAHRAIDWATYREWNISNYISLALAMSFFPELLLLLFTKLEESKDRENIDFLKKSFMLSGSINPDFMQSLNELIGKARPFPRRELEKVKLALSKSEGSVYSTIISISRSQKHPFTKLFFEKLAEASNGNFVQAIDNIQKEIYFDRSDTARNVKKRAESIKGQGESLFYMLLVALLLYGFLPMRTLLSITSGLQ